MRAAVDLGVTFAERVRHDPIRALAWIEAVATVCAAVADACTIVLDPAAALSLRFYGVTVLTSLACTAALFSTPHSQNRRYPVIALAGACIVALGWLPPHGILMIVLSAIFAARLTFAFGFRGALMAWIVACVALSVSVYADISSSAGMANAGDQPHGLVAYALQIVPSAILLGLIFGMIGLMKVYAVRSADVAATSERTRIALDLHDSLGHGLTTLRVQLQNAERYRTPDPSKADEYVVRALATSGELLSDVRETVTLLHDDRKQATPSFALLFERLCTEFAENHETSIERRIECAQEPTGRVAVALYRTIQEALTNVARHAGARHVWIAVRSDGQTVEASVEDDGRGVGGATHGIGNGVAWMRERIVGVGGEFTIAARSGGGTIVRAHVPVEATR